jgi:hypothetical protein
MEEINEVKQIRRLCECLFPYRKNRIIHNIENLAFKVGVTKERLVALITKFQNYDNINKNILITNYNSNYDKSESIEISLTDLGEYIVSINEEYLWKQIIEDFFN